MTKKANKTYKPNRYITLLIFLLLPLSIVTLFYITSLYFNVFLSIRDFIDNNGLLEIYILIAIILFLIDIICATFFEYQMLLFPLKKNTLKDTKAQMIYNIDKENMYIIACDLKRGTIMAVGEINANHTFSIDEIVFEEGKIISLHEIKKEDLDFIGLEDIVENKKRREFD